MKISGLEKVASDRPAPKGKSFGDKPYGNKPAGPYAQKQPNFPMSSGRGEYGVGRGANTTGNANGNKLSSNPGNGNGNGNGNAANKRPRQPDPMQTALGFPDAGQQRRGPTSRGSGQAIGQGIAARRRSRGA